MIGDRIRALRERCGLNRGELGQAIGVSEAAIEHYEANRWQPGNKLIVKMAELLHVTVPELVGECLTIEEQDGSTIYIKNIGCGRYCTVGRIK